MLLKVKNPLLQKEIDEANILKANLSCWEVDVALEQNVHLIVFLILLFLTAIFFTVGLLLSRKDKKEIDLY